VLGARDAQQVHLRARVPDRINGREAHADFRGLEGHHATEGDVVVAHLLELLHGGGIGLGTPALSDTEGLEGMASSLVLAEELVGEVQGDFLAPAERFRHGGLANARGVQLGKEIEDDVVE